MHDGFLNQNGRLPRQRGNVMVVFGTVPFLGIEANVFVHCGHPVQISVHLCTATAAMAT